MADLCSRTTWSRVFILKFIPSCVCYVPVVVAATGYWFWPNGCSSSSGALKQIARLLRTYYCFHFSLVFFRFTTEKIASRAFVGHLLAVCKYVAVWQIERCISSAGNAGLLNDFRLEFIVMSGKFSFATEVC